MISSPEVERRRLFRRMLRNAGHITGGNAVAVGLGMATLAVSAQMLGPALLGILAMIESYGKLIDQVVRFETWQAIIRYGAGALERADRAAFARLVKLGMVLDYTGALLTAAIAFILVPVAGAWLGWDESAQDMARLYSVALCFGVSSTPTGILRLFDHFAEIAWVPTVLAAIRLVGTALIWLLGGSLWPLMILVITLTCAERIALNWFAWTLLRRNGYGRVLHTPLRGASREFPGIAGFIIAANGTVLIRKSTQEFDILLVGRVAGPQGAGIYQLVRKLALAATKAGGMIQQVVYPDLARLWARRDYAGFLHAIGRIEAVTALFGVTIALVFVFAGEHLIRLIGGNGFEDAIVPLTVQSLAALLFVSGSALRPALMATGHQMQMLWIVLVSGVVFYVVLFLAVPHFGVVGASIAHVAFNLVWLPASLLLFASIMRRASAATDLPPD